MTEISMPGMWPSDLALGLELAFAVAMLVAAACDIAWRRLPNWLTAGVAVAYLPWAWAVGIGWGGVAVALAVGAVVLGLGFGLFAAGVIGGGDAKLAAAVALWVGLSFELIRFFLVMSLAGGVLAVIILAARAFARGRPQRPLPYGVAIAAAALDFWIRHSHVVCWATAC